MGAVCAHFCYASLMVLLLFAGGLIIGSFLNALVWRLHHKRDWVQERSECTHCHHKLSVLDLIPVASWVFLGGKCRYCHKKIDDSPLTEFGLGLAFALSYVFWPYAIQGISHVGLFMAWLIILSLFAVLCVYDFKWFLLPDKFTFAVIPVAVIFSAVRIIADPSYSLLATLSGAFTCFGIFYLLFKISAGKWIGGGDVKLAFPLGILAGSFGGAISIIFVSSVLGTLYALPLIIKYKKIHNVKVPYGPFLMAATVLIVIFYSQFYDLLLLPLFSFY